MRWEDCSAAIPRGPKCATLEGDRTAANVPFTYRLKIPDGYHIPPHTHPADAHLTVIAGTLNIGFGDKLDVKATKPMPAGKLHRHPERNSSLLLDSGRDDRPVAGHRPLGGGLRQSCGGPKEEVATGAA